VLVEPVAKLYANDDYTGETGIHYLGPTWESNSGSKVVATRADGCNADPTAIDWLLLRAVTNDGSGPFKKVTYVQRVLYGRRKGADRCRFEYRRVNRCAVYGRVLLL
jgi:hypothetical protein